MTKRTLQRRGYKIKHTDEVGWWVDGAFGYLVSGFWDTEGEAVADAAKCIKAAVASGSRPAWLFA